MWDPKVILSLCVCSVLIKPTLLCMHTAKHHDGAEVGFNVDISCCKNACSVAVKLLCFPVFAMIKLFPLICAAAYWNTVTQAFFHFPQNSTELGHLFLYAEDVDPLLL